jgi:hypothetical protein
MAMNPISFGKPDGSHAEKPLFSRKNIIELSGEGAYDFVNLPLAPTNVMSFGDGTAGKYPKKLEDGVILTPFDISAIYDNVDKRNVMGFGANGRYGSEFYNFAADANRIWYMVFTANTFVVAENDNQFHDYNTSADPYVPNWTGSGPTTAPVINPAYDSGVFGSGAVTGIKGSFEVWVPARLLTENSIATYTLNAAITVKKGRFGLGTTGDIEVGKVKRIQTTGSYPKVLLAVSTDSRRVI